MKFRILSALLRSSWAIDERFAVAHGGIIAGLLNGFDTEAVVISDQDPHDLPFAIDANRPEKTYSVYDEAPLGSVAVIPVRGPLMKEDQADCGYFTAGMETLGARLREADAHPNIAATILLIDSPGGTVDGTQAFADTVKAAFKPVVAFVDGLAASAALWIASAADMIVARNTTTEIGSIGVMVSFADMQPMWEREGVKFHRIMADQSKDKNREFTDALAGNYDRIREQSLNPLAQMFIDAIKANRPMADESVFTGKVYFAEEAIRLGLADEIGTIEIAASRAVSLSETKNESIIKPTNTLPPMKNFALLNELLAVDALENSDEGVFLNEEQLEAIETRLATQAAVPEPAEPDTAIVDSLNQRIADLETELAEARRMPAAEPASTSTATDAPVATEDINAKLNNMSIADRIAWFNNQ